MNEFIVWDKKTKKFREHSNIVFWSSMDYMYATRKKTKVGDIKFIWLKAQDIIEDRSYQTKREGHQVVVCKDIGLKDINGKNIYADCSIVEFNYYIKEQHFSGVGYITYLQNLCCYCICDFNKLKTTIAETELLEFKIIDTIQENKLGWNK